MEWISTAVTDNSGDRNFAGDVATTAAGRHIQTSLRMSSSCPRGQLAAEGGSGGAVLGRNGCGRPLVAMADLTAALFDARGGLAGSAAMGRIGLRLYGQARVRVERRGGSGRGNAHVLLVL